MNVIFHNKRGRSSFPLTNSIFVQDGYCTTNQLSIIIYRKIIDGTMICIEYQQSTCLFSMVFHGFCQFDKHFIPTWRAKQSARKRCIDPINGGLTYIHTPESHINGGFLKWRYPKSDSLCWKILLKWMITGNFGGYPQLSSTYRLGFSNINHPAMGIWGYPHD